MNKEFVLTINPGSTSTKIAIFKGLEQVFDEKIEHPVKELENFQHIIEQNAYRTEKIKESIEKHHIELKAIKAVVGRGGLLRPMPGGTYLVTEPMLADLRKGVQGEHASNLGGLIAQAIATEIGVDAFIVDPVAVDEMDKIARISGIPQIERRSLGHALNIKAVSHRYANEVGQNLKELRLIVAHLGGGISVAPVAQAKIKDYNNANEMGPFSPERTGGLPVGDLVKLCFSGTYSHKEMKRKIKGKGGIVSYLGTNDLREIEKMMAQGDVKAQLIFDAMCYQIGKEIGQMATVLKGQVDAIIITGGMAHSEKLCKFIKEMVSFIAKVVVYPGEDEMKALNEGVHRVLKGEEIPKKYEKEVDLHDE